MSAECSASSCSRWVLVLNAAESTELRRFPGRAALALLLLINLTR